MVHLWSIYGSIFKTGFDTDSLTMILALCATECFDAFFVDSTEVRRTCDDAGAMLHF